MDHSAFPKDLRESMYRFLDKANADERKPGQTDAQFYYNTRKKAIGPFKPELWALSGDSKDALYEALEDKFAFFYQKLNVVDTRQLVDQIVQPVSVHKPIPEAARVAGDDLGLAD